MHEMLKESDTESLLKETCVPVGNHLYIRKGIGEDIIEHLDNDLDREGVQIVFSMGGKGTRVQHLTGGEYSKHLIEVNGKPLSRHVVDLWLNNGFKNFAILVDDTDIGKGIMDYYKDGSQLDAKVEYSVEPKKLGSGGAFRLAIDNGTIKKSFISHYPDDVIVNYPEFSKDFSKVFFAALKAGYEVLVLCVPGKRHPYGVVKDDGTKVVDFVEKPFVFMDSSTGIYAFSDKLFENFLSLEPEKEIKVERSVMADVAKSGKMLKVLLPTEMWVPVNDENSLNKLKEIIKVKNQ